jgi:hypothetical protein
MSDVRNDERPAWLPDEYESHEEFVDELAGIVEARWSRSPKRSRTISRSHPRTTSLPDQGCSPG